MFVNHVRLSILVCALFALGAIAILPLAGNAQRLDTYCQADFATSLEPLDSQGLGLTHEEMDDLYGEGIAADIYWVYERDGYTLALSQCNLEVWIDPDGAFADPDAARQLARELLPHDSSLMGAWAFGNITSTMTDAEEWVSPSLALRYRELGEPRMGSILVMYAYTHLGPEDDRITTMYLGSAASPDEESQ